MINWIALHGSRWAFPHKAASHDSFRQKHTVAVAGRLDDGRVIDRFSRQTCRKKVFPLNSNICEFTMADVGEVLMSVLSTIRVPKPGDRVHKDECALSFASPVSVFFYKMNP